MSGHDYDQNTAPSAAHEQIIAPKGGGQSAEPEIRRPAVDDTWKKIEQILRHDSKASDDLARLVSLLDADHMDTFATEHFATLGQVASGDVVVDVGRVLELPPSVVLARALQAKTSPSKAVVRRYVQELSGDHLETIEGDAFDRLKRLMAGGLLEHLPGVIEKLGYLDKHAGFITWFVETSAPSIVAHHFARNGSTELAQTLDGLSSAQKWTWVDHVQLAQGSEGIVAIAKAAPDPIKQKLEAKLGPVADDKARDTYRHRHAKDVTTALENHAGVRELLDAVARVGRVEIDESHKVLDALSKLGPSADDVLAMSTMISVQGAVVMRLLMNAKDVTAAHLQSYLYASGGFGMLADDAKLLSDVRKKLPKLRITDLIQTGGQYSQQDLVENAAMRRWFFETATPADLMWFCGGEDSARACKLMDARDSSWRWVYDVTADAPKRQLRGVALNCPKLEIAKYVREVLLAEPAPRHEVVDAAQPPPPETKAGETGRLLDSLDANDNVLERIADLDEAKRARYGRIDTFVAGVAKRMGGRDFARAAVLLDLDFGRVVAHCPSGSGAIVAYLRTRPRSEELAVLADQELITRALTHIHPDPTIVFPLLRDPEQLAKAIEAMPKLVELLFKHAEPNLVADLLSREPVVTKTGKILDKHPELLDWLPRYRHMSKRGKEGLDRLAKPAHGEVAETLHDIRENDYDPRTKVKDEGVTASGARKQTTAAAAIQHLLDNGATPTTALGVLGEFNRDQITALLSERSNSRVVNSLAAILALPAHIVFPQLSLESLLGMHNARAWLFDYDAPTVLLGLIANRPIALAKVAAELDHETGANALVWLGRLPVGAALTDVEARVLDRMLPSISNAQVVNTLFAVRFGVPVPTEWDATTLTQLYKAVCRLPRAHLNQQRIKEIADGSLDASKGGVWTGEKIVINSSIKPGSDSEEWHNDKPRMTKAQIQRLYGWNDVELGVQVRIGNARYHVGADQYEIVSDKVDKFSSTVLHEIGHSIDDILGGHTDPVFQIAQWRSYAQGDVDKWAAEMGGWDRVTTSDQKKIAEVWVDSIRSNTPVYQLVDSDHPALASRYADVGIVSSAREKKGFDYNGPVVIGERAFIMQPYYGRFYSLSAQAVATKPSTYSLYAPQEYFAECYVEYYREVDGTPGSRGKKGGALPGPVKNWFTNHVDTLKYDPQRFEKQDDASGDGGD